MRIRRPIRAALLALLAVVVLVSGGCERRSDAVSGGVAGAQLAVSSEFGRTMHLRGTAAAGETVLDGLRAAVPVRTAYGGGFVSEMYGLASDPGGGRDWFFWVNGRLADRGARDVTVAAGDHVWWDYHRWSARLELTAVVGAWPVPFVTGDRIGVVADPPFQAWLSGLGVQIVDDSPWRIRVGSVDRLRRIEPDWASASDRGGLPVIIDEDGVRILAGDGASMARVPDGAAVVVAIPGGGSEGLVVVIAGRDAAAAAAAASTVLADQAVLQHRVAVAFDDDGTPLAAAGQVP